MDKIYKYVNASVMPVWLAMIFAPRHPLTEKASRSSTVFGVAALHYLGALIAAVLQNSRGSMPDLTRLEGLQKALSTPTGALTAWTHMLTWDLFAGAWIYRQSRRLRAPDVVRVVSLLLTLITGPAGLLFFLFWRAIRKGEQLPGFDM